MAFYSHSVILPEILAAGDNMGQKWSPTAWKHLIPLGAHLLLAQPWGRVISSHSTRRVLVRLVGWFRRFRGIGAMIRFRNLFLFHHWMGFGLGDFAGRMAQNSRMRS